MNKKIKKYALEIAKYAIILIIALNVVSYYKSKDLNKEKLAFDTFELIDGSSYVISKEKPLLIYFWATWCPICKFQSPEIEDLSKEYQVITIATQSGTKKEIEDYLKNNNFTFKVVDDFDNSLASKFNIKGFPTTLIYNKKGEVEFTDVGYTSSFSLKLKLWWSK